MYAGGRGQGGQARVFSYAILGSILFHALLLSLLPTLRDSTNRTRATPGPIVARLAEPRIAPPQVVPPAPPPISEPQPPAVLPAPPPKPAVSPTIASGCRERRRISARPWKPWRAPGYVPKGAAAWPRGI